MHFFSPVAYFGGLLFLLVLLLGDIGLILLHSLLRCFGG